ncbi:hypothetical protein C8F04DRAFT_26410 [Mycena alexandri]|uniref:Uncharacterized protein n=1 Tax=Mycena alexandri TaxID=1745969 RepID=A0AAD6TJS3_9AGAR|nr:hypothetical protein C8F04DRAFT_26410 [Mycena alexandri]
MSVQVWLCSTWTLHAPRPRAHHSPLNWPWTASTNAFSSTCAGDTPPTRIQRSPAAYQLLVQSLLMSAPTQHVQSSLIMISSRQFLPSAMSFTLLVVVPRRHSPDRIDVVRHRQFNDLCLYSPRRDSTGAPILFDLSDLNSRVPAGSLKSHIPLPHLFGLIRALGLLRSFPRVPCAFKSGFLHGAVNVEALAAGHPWVTGR